MSTTLNCNTTHVISPVDKHSQTDSTSLNSTADEDFRNLDRSSSFQTSTDSPYKISSMQQSQQQPDISGLKFFNQGLNTSNDTHANFVRKSIIVSPSWREIKTESLEEEVETPTADLSFSFENETPTNNFGMIASPSLQKLSDILTSKVNNSKLAVPSLGEIAEDSELETIFNGDNTIKRNQSVNTFYTSQTIASNETYQLSNHLSAAEQPDLIDLASPALQSGSMFDPKNDNNSADLYQREEPLNFMESPERLSKSSSASGGYNYTDIYEHYSPQRNPSMAEDNLIVPSMQPQEYNNNRVSVISEQFTLQNIKTPRFDNEFFQDDDADNESVKHSGNYQGDDTTTSDFSFVPSVQPQQQKQQPPQIISTPVKRNTGLDSPFLQNASNRLSMRIVENDNEPRYNFGLTPVLDVNSPLFNGNYNVQPHVNVQPQVQQVNQDIQNVQNVQNIQESPLILQDPIEKSTIPNTQQYSSLIDVSYAQKNLPSLNQSSALNNTSQFDNQPQQSQPQKSQPQKSQSLQPQPRLYNSGKQTPKIEQLPNDDKRKKGKLTFKGLFKREDPVNSSQTKTQARPKSFSFGNMENSDKKVPAAERKEKSKSLLSSWKRKSIFSSTTSLAKEDHQLPKTPKTPKTPTTPRKSRTMSFGSIGRFTPRQLSPHKHSQSVPVSNVDLVNENMSQISPAPTPLLASYGLDSTPNINEGNFNYPNSSNVHLQSIVIQQKSPDFENIPVINKKASIQQFSVASMDEYQEGQSAVIDYESPVSVESIEKVIDLSYNDTTLEDSVNDKSSQDIHTSSVYESADADLFSPPTIQTNKPVTPPNIYIEQFDNIQTPLGATPSTIGHNTPASMTVASFTASPNKFHIGDDLFPKNLDINEIESIVTLERSRSMRSVKSNRIPPSIRSGTSAKKTIVQIMQDRNDDFDEIILPDGSILVKSPSFPAHDTFSNVSRTGSILKPHASSPLVVASSGDDLEIDQELSDLMDMINFDTDDDNLLDTNFDFDTNFDTNISPSRKAVSPVKPQRQNAPKSYSPLRHSFEPPRKLAEGFERESSVPDFLGIDADYYEYDDFETFEAFESPMASKVSFHQYDSPVEYIAPKQRQVSRESVEHIIRVEENYYPPELPVEEACVEDTVEYREDAFIPDSQANRISMSFKGLKAPLLNNSLKPTTQDAIMGSINQLNSGIVPSDSENSLFQNVYGDLNNNSNYEYSNDFVNEYQQPKVEPLPTFVPILAPQLQNKQQSENTKRYSLNNPFHDYSQSYDELPVSNQGSPIEKSKRFMQRLSNNDFGHLSTASLPATTKPKKLNKRRNKSTASFGKLFGAKEETPKVQFSSRILLYETYGEDEYDREPDVATCNNLTPKLATAIKAELNELKSTMPIHEDSKCYTHFF